MSAVVEGVGDHGCEYMTGGRVVVLGETGRNFAAGMSGGIAYVYDRSGMLDKNCNKALVKLEAPSERDLDTIREMLEKHLEYTGSDTAEAVLGAFETESKKFVKVIPSDYEKVMTVMEEEKAKGATRDEAMLTAFESVTGKSVG